MRDLRRKRAAYVRALERAELARLAYVAEIELERGRGSTLDAIGRELGIGRERVRQILIASQAAAEREGDA